MDDLDIPPVPPVRASLASEITLLHDGLLMQLQRGMCSPPDNATPEHRRRCYADRAYLCQLADQLHNLRVWAESGISPRLVR